MTAKSGPWGLRPGADDGAQTIRSAGVDLDGDLITAGAMSYPPDDKRRFAAVGNERLRVSRTRGMRIVRCRAERDPSGFFCSEELGPELHIPDPLADMITTALRVGLREPLEASIRSQAGWLADSTSRIKTLFQPLSDWHLRVDEADGATAVRLSAALHATHLQEWNTSTANYWTWRGVPPRIDVSFTVDAITRVACFGAYVDSLDQASGEQPAAPHSVLSTLNITNAPVGAFAAFGVDGERWIKFYEPDGPASEHTIAFTEHGPPTRTATGLLKDSADYRWPRVWLNGVDMGVIAAAMGLEPSLRLELRGGAVGRLDWHREEPSEEVVAAELDLALTEAGLRFGYRLQAATSRAGSFVLPWELLILRYPAFARRRERVLAARQL